MKAAIFETEKSMAVGFVGSMMSGKRRGNVMLFVLFILMSLFTASVAFLTLLRSDAKVLVSEQDKYKLDAVIGSLEEDALLSMSQSLMGQQKDREPYLQNDDSDGDGDNPDGLARYAEIPGVTPWLASIEPYQIYYGDGSATGRMEYFSVTDLWRTWDNKPDVYNVVNAAPTSMMSHTFRIRPINASGLISGDLYYYTYEQTNDWSERHGAPRDADGDGVIDSYEFKLSLLGDGEPDYWNVYSGGPDGASNDASDSTIACGVLDVPSGPFQGQPSFTVDDGTTDYLTPVPCDDLSIPVDGILSSGTGYPFHFLRNISKAVMPDDTDDRNEYYVAMRVISNGGMASLNSSHWTIVDNIFGLDRDKTDSAAMPVASYIKNLPYTSSDEKWLRRRGFLPTRDVPDNIPMGLDLNDTNNAVLNQTVTQPLSNSMTIPQYQWFPITDEPGNYGGDGEIYDEDWSVRWMNPFVWNDVGDNAGLGNTLNYDVRHLITVDSTDDLLMRQGYYATEKVVLTDFLTVLSSGRDIYDTPSLAYNPVDDVLENSSGVLYDQSSARDSALLMYPGVDPYFVAVDCDPANDIGDRSFYKVDRTGCADVPPVIITTPKLPLFLDLNDSNEYMVPRDYATGEPVSNLFGNMQFALHSIGDINNPTQHEIQTVLDYFTVMLRNVTNGKALGLATGYTQTDLDNAIHDQAAQLTANFFDFADYDSKANPNLDAYGNPILVPGGAHGYDLPTRVVSRTGTAYYGVEKQPYISEVYVDTSSSTYAVELTNPHNVAVHLAPVAGNFEYGLKIKIATPTDPFVIFTNNAANEIPAGEIRYYSNSYNDTFGHNAGTAPALFDEGTSGSLPAGWASGAVFQLVRDANPNTDPDPDIGRTWVVVDEVEILSDTGIIKLQRDNNLSSAGGWFVTVPVHSYNIGDQTVGDPKHRHCFDNGSSCSCDDG